MPVPWQIDTVHPIKKCGQFYSKKLGLETNCFGQWDNDKYVGSSAMKKSPASCGFSRCVLLRTFI